MKKEVKIGIIAGSAILVIALIYYLSNKASSPLAALKATAYAGTTAAQEVAAEAASEAHKGLTYVDSLIPNGDDAYNENLT